jgi:cation diffusion facilitator CzcD-associated flavoprotein CzcO
MQTQIEKEARAYMAKHIKDPVLLEALTPKYRPGCKRICQSADYYPALAQPNVKVVPTGLDKVRPGSVLCGGRWVGWRLRMWCH